MELLGVFITLFTVLKESSSVTVILENKKPGELRKEVSRGDNLKLLCYAIHQGDTEPASAFENIGMRWIHFNFDQTASTIMFNLDGWKVHPKVTLIKGGIVLRNMRVKDAGYYVCEYTMHKEVPPIDSARYLVTVKEAISPLVPQFPESHYIMETMAARFECPEKKRTGDPRPKFRWYKDGQLLPPQSQNAKSSYIYFPDNGTFLIPVVKPWDYGVYRCEAYNKYESRRSESVDIKPVWRSGTTTCHFPAYNRIIPGRTTNFTCRNTMPRTLPKASVAKYRWFKGPSFDELPANSEDKDEFSKSNFSIDAKTGTLTFHKVTEHDFGVYQCEKFFTIRQVVFNVSCDRTYIQAPTPPGNLTCVFQLRDGSLEASRLRTNFTCQETIEKGIPPVLYKWYRNDQELPTSSASDSKFSESKFSYDQNSGTFVFEGVSTADEGVYRCVAYNGADEVTQCKSPYLRLSAPPNQAICEFPEGSKMPLGETSSFRCRETEPGSTKPQIYWMKGDWLGAPELLEEHSEPNSLNPDWSYTSNRKNGTLVFTSVNYSDAGIYSCKIVNFEGESYCKGSIFVTKEFRAGVSGSRSLSPWIIVDAFLVVCGSMFFFLVLT